MKKLNIVFGFVVILIVAIILYRVFAVEPSPVVDNAAQLQQINEHYQKKVDSLQVIVDSLTENYTKVYNLYKLERIQAEWYHSKFLKVKKQYDDIKIIHTVTDTQRDSLLHRLYPD